MRVAYTFNKDVGNYHYGKHHPMKPYRSAIVNNLVHLYKLTNHMDVLAPTKHEASGYHPDGYPFDDMKTTDDCPLFYGRKAFCAEYTSSSICAANALLTYDVAINWAGGMHHARKNSPSGFCYMNDIVMAIQRLLSSFERVMYIDIDIHHGDGVEEAFGLNERVLTCSFHKYGDGYFPGTGNLLSNHFSCNKAGTQQMPCGADDGVQKDVQAGGVSDECTGGSAVHSECSGADPLAMHRPFQKDKKIKNVINVPLRTGIDDWSYKYVFEPVTSSIIRKFDPDVIVVQCGADSLGEDRLGCFNLSVQGHGACVEYLKSFNKKMLVVGGGGYTLKNVVRAWTYETSVLVGVEIPGDIPQGTYTEYFQPSNSLFPDFKRKYENENTKSYLDSVTGYIHNVVDRG
ncbi:Histone deacetylase complex, catalytic component RPD3 [Trachipleistophora hominis]|uniref:Histone deacetylase n=1 Tax=Trachipleistophora hominis TaxID=72359 RepID=L7JY58_TRAHO|nr:Histone deacetylase complex, catalytic component RPD3 [Trachipleistophora hominis]